MLGSVGYPILSVDVRRKVNSVLFDNSLTAKIGLSVL